ncbi:MAG TPA: VOC family protein [Solirubrobacteraceae bacterium]|nr:VOC family protein [Solirubrobacteraceae bacterium]
MSPRDHYPAGVPCWVDTLQPDPGSAAAFYAALLGWEIVCDDDEGPSYLLARLRGADVAGVAALPEGHAPGWITHVRVDDVEAAVATAEAAGATVALPPLDAAPAGRLAVLADPGGARFAVWQPELRDGAMRVNEPGAWAMSALRTDDPEGAAAFYAAVFGWRAEAWGPVHLLRLPGYVGGTDQQPVPRDVVAVMAPLGPGDGQSRWDVDFRVADAAAVAARAPELGGAVLAAPHARPPFLTAVLADPAGGAFSVSELAG